MNKLFIITGIITILVSIVLGILMIPIGSLISLLIGFIGVVVGLALIALADTMKRVRYLQMKLNLYMPEDPKAKTPQKTCPGCQTEIDFDFPKCPACGSIQK